MGKKICDSRTWFKNEFSKNSDIHMLTDEELKKLHDIELEMLCDFLKVVKEQNISYTMSGGSVLGTIRHGGFIPWDDDIDINMPRKSYNRFRDIFSENLGDKYELWTPESGKDHGLSLVQIKKKGTIYQSFNELSKQDNGICMDIFILENMPDNAVIRRIHGCICLAVGYLLTCRKTYHDLPYLEKYISDNQALKKAIMKKAQIGKLFAWIPLDKVSMLTSKVYSMCKNHNSDLVTIPSGRKHYFGEMLPRKELCESVEMDFEGIKVNIPKGYKKYMEKLYGKTYMTVPAAEDRERHPLMRIDFGG